MTSYLLYQFYCRWVWRTCKLWLWGSLTGWVWSTAARASCKYLRVFGAASVTFHFVTSFFFVAHIYTSHAGMYFLRLKYRSYPS